MSEVFYRVWYQENTAGLYTIKEIQIEFMLESNLDLDEAFCSGDSSEVNLITQKFGIEFLVARDGVADADGNITLDAIAATS